MSHTLQATGNIPMVLGRLFMRRQNSYGIDYNLSNVKKDLFIIQGKLSCAYKISDGPKCSRNDGTCGIVENEFKYSAIQINGASGRFNA